MPHFAPVSRERHLRKRWRTAENYSFAAADALAPAVGAELQRLALVTPLAFVWQEESYRLMAVLSFEPRRNVFVAPDGRWLGSYAPAFYSSYPFRLLPREGTDDSLLCIDEDGRQIVDADASGEPFFGPDGNLSEALKPVFDYLIEFERHRKATQIAVSALGEAGLITPWRIKLKIGQQEQAISGLHRIDEGALNALGGDEFLRLRKTSALPLAYAQLLSMGQITLLERLGAYHLSSTPAMASTAPTAKSLDDIFNVELHGLVRFE